MKIREKCYEGTLTNSPLRIKAAIHKWFHYRTTFIVNDKMSQIELMCQRYIEVSHWPQFVSPFLSVSHACILFCTVVYLYNVLLTANHY